MSTILQALNIADYDPQRMRFMAIIIDSRAIWKWAKTDTGETGKQT